MHHTRAINNYEGNLNFSKEKQHMVDMRTKNDFTMYNPHLQAETQISNFEEIKEKVIALCRKRSGNGLRGLRIMFKAMDRNRDRSLDPTEFKYAMRDYGVPITDQEVNAIVKYFDSNRDGKISFDEFLRAIRGDLNEHRRKMVHLAYGVLDKDGSGQVTLEDILLVRIIYLITRRLTMRVTTRTCSPAAKPLRR